MSSNAEDLVNQFCAAFARGKVDELVGFFTDDGAYHNVPTGEARGRTAVRKALEAYVPNARAIEFRVLRSASAGDVVFNERLDVFEMKDGKHVELPVAGVFEVRAGKIAPWRDYFDINMWTRQMR